MNLIAAGGVLEVTRSQTSALGAITAAAWGWPGVVRQVQLAGSSTAAVIVART
jgi:hypothetical protein